MRIEAMGLPAKLFKSGNSWAVRLPAALKPSSKELFVEQGRDGDIILYNEKERKKSYARRLRALQRIMANPVLDKDEATPRL